MGLSEKKVQVSLLFSSSFHFSYETCHNLGVLIGHFQTYPNIIHYFLHPNYITIISHDISNVWLNKIHKVVVAKTSPWAMGLSQQPRLQQVFAPNDEGKGRLCGCLGHLPILRLLGRAGRLVVKTRNGGVIQLCVGFRELIENQIKVSRKSLHFPIPEGLTCRVDWVQ